MTRTGSLPLFEDMLGIFERDLTHAERADIWIDENPLAFQAFCVRALAYAREERHVGAKKIVEDLRWSDLQAAGDQSPGFKYNNNYTAQLSRRAIHLYPILEKTLRTRKRRLDQINT